MNVNSQITELFTKKHPEFTYEDGVLSEVVKKISIFLETENPYQVSREDEWSEYGGADEQTATVLHFLAAQRYEDLKLTLREPYFGRLDITENFDGENTFYIGKRNYEFNNHRIINWAAPMGSLFYRSPRDASDQQTFFTGSGMHHAHLKLKRNIKIEEKSLSGLFDEYDFRNGKTGTIGRNEHEELIKEVLKSRSSPFLQDIVRTIQQEQDELIREKPDCYLVINGVAGSGKTTIAYHRIAVLLYQDSQGEGIGDKKELNPNRIIVFGPSRLFMSYVKELLPDLGVRGVVQASFDDWAMEQMRYKYLRKITVNNTTAFEPYQKYALQDSAIKVFLDRSIDKDHKKNLWSRARLKGGMKYKTLIERYIAHLTNCWKTSEEGYTFTIEDLNSRRVHLSFEELRNYRVSSELDGKPINIGREFYFSKVKEMLAQKYRSLVYEIIGEKQTEIDQKSSDSAISPDLIKQMDTDRRVFVNEYLGFKQNKVLEGINHQFRELLDQECPFIDACEIYYKLLGNLELLSELSKGLYKKDEVNLLFSPERKEGVIELEDVPAILYLYILVNGKSEASYDHIVVDEAQDFSPLQFTLLKIFNSQESMTIMGDINQGIYAHRGLHDWDELKQALGQAKVVQKDVLTNYRSTREITVFTNAVLSQTSNRKATLSTPFDREGASPIVFEAQTTDKMYQQIAKDVETLNIQGIRNIGIIVKQASDVETVYNNLRETTDSLFTCTSSRDDQFSYKGGNLIMPVDLSKGIEFEAVLVVNADQQNYSPDTVYDGRLLYVAVTRALHVLRVYACGSTTPYLDQARLVAKVFQI